MNEELLTRIANALEGIESELEAVNSNLQNLERDLDSCMIKVGDRSFLCMIVNVS